MRDKLRILHLCGFIPLFPNIGGFETIIRMTAEEQSRQGHEVFVLGKNIFLGKKKICEINNNGVCYVQIKIKQREKYCTPKVNFFTLLTGFLSIFTLVPYLVYVIYKKKIDVVIFYKEPITGPLALISRMMGRPSILGHFVFHKSARKRTIIYDFIFKMLFFCYSAAFTYTKFFFSLDEKVDNIGELSRYLGSKNVYEIPFGINEIDNTRRIDLNQVNELKEGGNYVVVCPRRMTYQKGVNILFDSIPQVLKQINNVVFIFVGDGELREPLIEKSKEMGLLDKIIFTGQTPQETVVAYLKNADVMIMPSLNEEDFGVALLEAYSAKVPIIASRFGGIPNIVEENISGLLFTPGNSVELAQAIVKLLKDQNLRKTFVDKGYSLLKEKYVLSKYVSKLTDVMTPYVKR